MTASLERLKAAVAEFHRWVELPRHSQLTPKLMFEFTPRTVWADKYLVDAGLPGCYVFEDDAGEPYYVGSVSANSDFGRRFANSYFSRHPIDRTQVVKSGHAAACMRIYVVDVPREYAFLAPALEQFLISYLHPRVNGKDSVAVLRRQLIAEGRIPASQPQPNG